MQFRRKSATIGEVNAQQAAPLFRTSDIDGDGSAWIESWTARVRAAVRSHIEDFVRARCAEELQANGFEFPSRVLLDFLSGGKSVRPTFMYLGWLCGADESEAALRAAASIELLHGFALLQDDVMDESGARRGRPTAHVRLARWHEEQGLSGSPARFGESAAVLLGDLCLVWAERMLRESGVDAAALSRVWPRYDAMRAELAVGQLADLVNDAAGMPTLEQVLDIARRKSGNYTVRRPLELGAAMAGCAEPTIEVLGEYGVLIGEAFQLRDDLLGIFGEPSVTGKPANADLRERKATTVVALAEHLAGPPGRTRLHDLWRRDTFDNNAVQTARELIVDSGAPQRAEQMIAERVEGARTLLSDSVLDPTVTTALQQMAMLCTRRST
ncbi:polyprenyl synthetase family protein [Nocardia speluncae]|uniref:Polyprenyl synthetase family protein n=1 Tax=Nocardia speluncae TaxID=419477 RepID=A0A846XE59_9NOCA|nr:polyprenyl synthetase family protein [Nocardia speluncae]